MPDAAFTIDSTALQRALARLKAAGGNIGTAMEKVIDRGCIMLVNEMKSQHFFVGTGKGAEAKAKEHEFTFVNPDGTPRFKTRTANLINSMQTTGAQRQGNNVVGKVTVSMQYAREVDEGGPGRRAFPFKKPAMEQVKPKIRADATKIVNEMVRKINGKG